MLHLITDTVAGLPLETLERLGIPCVPQIVIFGQQSYREFYDITVGEFYTRQAAASELPRTSAPSPGEFEALFEQILAADPTAQILCIHPSAEVSGTVRSARPAAAMFPEARIRIFDTRSASLGQGMMVLEAARMAQAGLDADTILRRLAEMRDRMQVLFVPQTLDYLHKGGRIGRAAHLVGTMLDIKPLLAFREGVVQSHSKQRTHRRAIAAMRDLVLESARGRQGLHLGVMHALCEAEARALADELCGEVTPEVFLFGELGPAIGVHVGPGTLGVCWFVPD